MPQYETTLEPLWTYDEASDALKIPKNTLYAMVKKNTIPYIRVGPKTVRFYPSVLEQWLNQKTVGVKK